RFPNLLCRRLPSRQDERQSRQQRVWKPAIQQTWKSALLWLRCKPRWVNPCPSVVKNLLRKERGHEIALQRHEGLNYQTRGLREKNFEDEDEDDSNLPTSHLLRKPFPAIQRTKPVAGSVCPGYR